MTRRISFLVALVVLFVSFGLSPTLGHAEETPEKSNAAYGAASYKEVRLLASYGGASLNYAGSADDVSYVDLGLGLGLGLEVTPSLRVGTRVEWYFSAATTDASDEFGRVYPRDVDHTSYLASIAYAPVGECIRLTAGFGLGTQSAGPVDSAPDLEAYGPAAAVGLDACLSSIVSVGFAYQVHFYESVPRMPERRDFITFAWGVML